MSGTAGRSGGDRTTHSDAFPAGILRRPADLSAEEVAIWDHLIEKIPAELLRPIDCYQLGTLCSLIARERALAMVCRNDPSDFAAGRAHIAIAASINRLSVQFGLSPIDRRRFKLTATNQTDDGDEWVNG